VRRRFAEELERMVRTVRRLHHSYRTEAAFLGWTGHEEAAQLGADQVREFLEDLAVRFRVAASTQNQALNALVFFYREGVGRRSPMPHRWPVRNPPA
jgi:hypothetical protein